MINVNETKDGVTLRNNNLIRIENVVLANNSKLITPYIGKFGTEYKAEFVINKALEMGKINALLEIVNEYEKNVSIEDLCKSEYSEEKNYNAISCNSFYSRMNVVIRTCSRGMECEKKSVATGNITKVIKNPINFLGKGKERLEAEDFGAGALCHILVKMYGKTRVNLDLVGIMHTGNTKDIERPFDDSVFDDLVDLGVDNAKSKKTLSPF
jgi:hypothetical protein